MKSIPGPDPNPVKPKYVPPPGACDAHNHVFGPADRFPYAPNRSYTPPDAPKEKLAALHRHLGFSRSVLVQASCHGTDNSAMLDAIASSNGAWRGAAMVTKDVSEHVDFFATMVDDEGIRARILIDNPTKLYWADGTSAR